MVTNIYYCYVKLMIVMINFNQKLKPDHRQKCTFTAFSLTLVITHSANSYHRCTDNSC